LQLILCILGEDTDPAGQCYFLPDRSVSVIGLIPQGGSYLCTASSLDPSTQERFGLRIVVVWKQELPRPQSPSGWGDGGCVVLKDGSVSLHGSFLGGLGSYNCSTTSPNTISKVWIQVLGLEEGLSTSIMPTVPLPNGTLVAYRGFNVSFNCSGPPSLPSQTLSWGFRGAGPGNGSLATGSGTWLGLRIPDIQPSDQGDYWCQSQNGSSGQGSNRSTQLLVYYVPAQHPDCLWRSGQNLSEAQQFICSWPGAYPAPSLRWVDIHQGPDTTEQDHMYVVAQTDSLVVTLNRSQLSEGQTLKCIAQHPVLQQGEDKSCLLHFKLPFPEGKPLVTALEQSDVTLRCSEARSVPPASTTWRRGVEQEEILPGSRYLVVQEGPEVRLTIHNLTKEDEGVYFCRSKNPLGVRELEVYLTIKAQSAFTGAIVGVFIAALIVGIGAIAAKLVYSSRDRICLGTG
ncbi:hypothetical protein CRUP_026584, partial [Coryphaenoides rupestris]